MKGISYRSYGGPEVLEYGELPDPKLAPDCVLVKVKAAAVNPVDWKCQAGYLDGFLDAMFPVVPGWDVSGVVLQPGVSVKEFSEGDEVVGYVRKDVLGQGTFAEYVAAPVRTLARKPTALTFEEACTLPLAGLTAYQALSRWLGVGEGDDVLIHGAAGAVGGFAVQLALQFGARPIGAARPRDLATVRALGAVPVAYEEDLSGFAAAVRAVAPRGVTAALDTLGGPFLAATAELLAPGGSLASIADASVLGMGGHYVFVRPDAADLQAVSDLAQAGTLTARVAESYPLAKAADAQRRAMAGGLRGGKVVVTVD
ncbi:NADP-dependent oxidoreductase [Streptacidiphilus monticola]|uniref:NADP-dependent oxidoreductase n=1 Tax=Streptacidiphilus monticola TaxID=2161674 RepID=A0ABW1G447_9ACTN